MIGFNVDGRVFAHTVARYPAELMRSLKSPPKESGKKSFAIAPPRPSPPLVFAPVDLSQVVPSTNAVATERKLSRCAQIIEQSECQANDCSWIPALDSATGKQKRKAYCRTKPKTAAQNVPHDTPAAAQATKSTPPPAEPKQAQPVAIKTGIVRKNRGRDAVATLRITTPAGSHYLLKVIDAKTGKEEVLFYIEGGKTFDTKVPLGTYKIRAASGTIWYGAEEFFGSGTSFFELRQIKGEDTFAFTRSKNVIHGHHLKLTKQIDGTMESNPIGRNQF